MYVDNVIQSGDYITPIPLGLQIRLQYSQSGALQSVMLYHSNSYTDKVPTIVTTLISYNSCPSGIHLRGGTTWVDGVLYTNKLIDNFSGSVDTSAFEDVLIAKFLNHPEEFKFYASNVESLATPFKGCAPIRNWLNMNGFNLLPGWAMNSTPNRNTLLTLLKGTSTKFMYPVFAGYTIFRRNQVLRVSTKLTQMKIKSLDQVTDDNGYIYCRISDKSISVNVPYSNVVKFGLHANVSIVLDAYNNIIYSDSDSAIDSNCEIYCSTCNKLIHVRADDVAVRCNDPNCLSNLYCDCIHLLKVFNLPEITPGAYWSHVRNKDIISIPDILDLDDYSMLDANPLSLTLVDLLSAIVPLAVTSDVSIFNRIANRCRNNVSTFDYYIHNPDSLAVEIGSPSKGFSRLIQWLSVPYNQSNISALLMNPRIKVVETNKLFEGPPVFQDKCIGITGTFLHGNHTQIKAILSSYGASVISSEDGLEPVEYVSSLDYLVIGQQNELTNGQLVRQAKANNVVIVNESEFFNHYEIDADICQNL